MEISIFFYPENIHTDILNVTGCLTCNTIKVPHGYVVQVSDTTMMPIAASSPGQELIKNEKLKSTNI